MPESVGKMARSPPMGAAGDISERELSRERHNLYSTPARTQRSHPKKLYSPVNKFTAKAGSPGPHLARIKSCLDEYRQPPKPKAPKAASMEDLTPGKTAKERKAMKLIARSTHSMTEAEAAARVARFVLLAAWRRRRQETRTLRDTVELQVSSSKRLRIQISALKSILDSDNEKLRLAMRELERQKQLLRDRDTEKAVLLREKQALERDVCAAEDRASEMSIGWRNSRNEAETARAAAAAASAALLADRAARDRAARTISILEKEVSQHKALLSSGQQDASRVRRELGDARRLLLDTRERLRNEQLARERCSSECVSLSARLALGAEQAAAARALVAELRAELASMRAELAVAREQLDWWPSPLTRMMGAARSWLRHPLSLRAAALWALAPARHGC